MGDVIDERAWNRKARQPKDGGEPPDMEQRIANLERDVSVVKATMATKEGVSDLKFELLEFKAEVHSLLRQNIMWSVGTIIAMGGLVFAIMRFTGG